MNQVISANVDLP